MTIPLYPEIIYEGDLTPDAVGEEVDEKIEVCRILRKRNLVEKL